MLIASFIVHPPCTSCVRMLILIFPYDGKVPPYGKSYALFQQPSMAAACPPFTFTFTLSPALNAVALDPQSTVAVSPDTSTTVQGTVAASNDVVVTALKLMAIRSANSDLNIGVLLIKKVYGVPIFISRRFPPPTPLWVGGVRLLYLCLCQNRTSYNWFLVTW